MSTLTKIAVVLLAVLVLMACPTFVQHAVTGPNYKKWYENEQARRKQAEANSAHQAVAADVWRRWGEDQKRRGETLAQQYQTDMDAKRMQIARLTQEKADLKALTEKLAADIAELQNSFKRAVARNDDQAGELKKQRQANIRLGDQLRQARAKNEELFSDAELLKRARGVLEEQVADKDVEIRDLRDEVRRLQEAGPAAVARRPAAKGPKIEGTVTAVKVDIASLNVGSASGVKKGMEFIIYRGANYVAHLQVEYVTASACSGIIVDAQLDVKIGDKVTTRLEVE